MRRWLTVVGTILFDAVIRREAVHVLAPLTVAIS
jgi:hypothetical protein